MFVVVVVVVVVAAAAAAVACYLIFRRYDLPYRYLN
jgi:hypothetical protein